MYLTIISLLLLDAIGIIAERCFTSTSVAAIVRVAGINTGGAYCSKLTGQFRDPDSNSADYLRYVHAHGATCSQHNPICDDICTINLASAPTNGLSDLLGGFKHACLEAGGQYRQRLLEIGSAAESPGKYHEDRSIGIRSANGGPSDCDHSVDHYTYLKVDDTYVDVSICEDLCGPFSDPMDMAYQYTELVELRDGTCARTNSPDIDYCVIEFATKPADGFSELLGDLESGCARYGGNYRQQSLSADGDGNDNKNSHIERSTAIGKSLRSIKQRRTIHEQCQSKSSVDTAFEAAGQLKLVAACDDLPGQFESVSSSAGKYISYVKYNGGMSCTLTSACDQVCVFKFIDEASPRIGGLLEGLKDACDESGGTFCEQQIEERSLTGA